MGRSHSEIMASMPEERRRRIEARTAAAIRRVQAGNMEAIDAKSVMKAAVKSLLLSDHMADVGDVIIKLLKLIGQPAPDQWEWLALNEVMEQCPEIEEWPCLWTMGDSPLESGNDVKGSTDSK